MKYRYIVNPLFQANKIIVFVVIVLINIGLFVRIDMLFSDLPRYLIYIFLDFLSIVFFNATIELETSDKGISVNYFFSYYFIPWTDIVELKRVGISSFFLPEASIWYIHVKKLPFIYRIFGLLISFRFIPCIILTRGIKNIGNLINEINSKILKEP